NAAGELGEHLLRSFPVQRKWTPSATTSRTGGPPTAGGRSTGSGHGAGGDRRRHRPGPCARTASARARGPLPFGNLAIFFGERTHGFAPHLHRWFAFIVDPGGAYRPNLHSGKTRHSSTREPACMCECGPVLNRADGI